jgi:hypothetical protein
MDGVKCFWSSNCPYYETTTSYGKERVMCSNTDCILHGSEDEEVGDTE